MTEPCQHPEEALNIQGFLPDGFVRANCRRCGKKDLKLKYSESFDDEVDIAISDLKDIDLDNLP